jgi:uroporphyrinogen-III synthase
MIKLLRDKIFISTRPGGPSDQLTQLLTASGASVLELPLIKIEAASLSEVENNYLSRLATFQWIIFTSPNGVRYFFEILKRTNGNHQLPAHVQMAVIGHKTGKTVESFGHPVSFVNPGSTAEDFSETFAQHIKNSLEKPNILLPLGNLARSVIQDSLKKTARCFRMVVYKTEITMLSNVSKKATMIWLFLPVPQESKTS